jgi:hypothetical protein
VTLIPTATFLAGALLSLLLPVILLTALVVWYLMFLRRVPEPTEETVAPDAAAVASPQQPGSSSG